MEARLASRVVSGRVITGGVAQSVAREGDLVFIALTCMPGHPAAISAEGETVVIPLPEPVAVKAGERTAIMITWLRGDSEARDYAGPVLMAVDQVIDRAHIRR